MEVVDWKPHLHDEAWAIVSSLYFTDGGAEDAATIAESGEPWRLLTHWIIKENPCAKKLSPQELYYWQEEREAYRKEYAKVWNETATAPNGEGMVDVIICPVGPGVAPAHNTAKYWGYTSQWNLLDYPAVVFPVSKVDVGKDRLPDGFKPLTDVDEEHWKLCECSFSVKVFGIHFHQMIQLSLTGYRSLCSLWEEDSKTRKSLQSWSTSSNRSVCHLSSSHRLQFFARQFQDRAGSMADIYFESWHLLSLAVS